MQQVTVFSTLKKFHQCFGLEFRFNDEAPWWIKTKNVWVKIAAILFIIMLFMASTKTFSNNNSMNLTLNFMYVMLCMESFFVTALLWKRRDKVEDLVQWCHQTEIKHCLTLNKPTDYFIEMKNKTVTTIR